MLGDRTIELDDVVVRQRLIGHGGKKQPRGAGGLRGLGVGHNVRRPQRADADDHGCLPGVLDSDACNVGTFFRGEVSVRTRRTQGGDRVDARGGQTFHKSGE